MTPTNEQIAETLEALAGKERELREAGNFGYLLAERDLNYAYRNHHAEIIAALRDVPKLRRELANLIEATSDHHDHSNVENEPCCACAATLNAHAALTATGRE